MCTLFLRQGGSSYTLYEIIQNSISCNNLQEIRFMCNIFAAIKVYNGEFLPIYVFETKFS